MEQHNPQGGEYFHSVSIASHSYPLRERPPSPPLLPPMAWKVGHPDQFELALQWPGVPNFEEVGRPSPAHIALAGRFVIAAIETLDGRRPLSQLVRYLHPTVYAAMQTRIRYSTPRHPTRVRSLHTYQPAASAIEACATLERQSRAYALAARLQRRRKLGWRCTALRVL